MYPIDPELELSTLIDRWCPPQFEHDMTQAKLLRAFLNAIACVEDQRAMLRGEQPIRTDYPDPAYPPRHPG